MAVGLAPKAPQAVDEEARAEVDVLNSRLERTTQLTKKIQSSLSRLETTSQNVRDVAGPLSGETRKLQVLGNSKCPRASFSLERLAESRFPRCRCRPRCHRAPPTHRRQ